jgi:hypothetical protein
MTSRLLSSTSLLIRAVIPLVLVDLVNAGSLPVQRKIGFSTENFIITLSVGAGKIYSGERLIFQHPNGEVCCSLTGQEGDQCIMRFVGCVVAVKYQVRSAPQGLPYDLVLRERVVVVAQDPRLEQRPPFERSQRTVNGAATDLQVFGYDETPLTRCQRSKQRTASKTLWRIYKQELFTGSDQTPFAVIKWKHTMADIRIIDVTGSPSPAWGGP